MSARRPPTKRTRRARLSAAGALLSALLAGLAVPAPAAALPAGHSLDAAVGYLQGAQNPDGGFGGEAGAASSPAFTSWVALALAAAGINPRDQARGEGADAYSYLTSHAAELASTTDFERELLVADAAGASPHDFGGVDLTGRIMSRLIAQPAAGGVAFGHEPGARSPGMNDTIFAVLALSPVHEPALEAAVQGAAAWIEHEQNADGSWPSTCPRTVPGCSPAGSDPEGESDMTAAAVEALNAAGRHDTAAQTRALAWLHRTQNAGEGGFAESLGEPGAGPGEADVGSTAWVVQAIWAAGQEPEAEAWRPGGVGPLSYIESLQQPDGHIRSSRSRDLDSIWMTAYAGPALAGYPLPVPAAPYVPRTPSRGAAGSGGEGAQHGSGVSAGGGGGGAPLFSRPQSQSTGRTPGGVRDRSARERARSTRRSPGSGAAPPHGEQQSRGTQATQSPAGGAAPSPASAGAGAGGPGAGTVPADTPRPGARGGARVTGIPISASQLDAHVTRAPAAPGLHGAGEKPSSPLPAIAVALAMLLLALYGAAIERRRPSAAS